MDQVNVPDTHVRAGREYLECLRTLGLNPEGVFWGQWDGSDFPNLLIVTSLFDRFGPLTISNLLFKAYRASALPQEIDPFIVELHSPNQSVIRILMRQMESEGKKSITRYGIDGTHKHQNIDKIQIKVENLTIPMQGLYVLSAPTMKPVEQVRTWRRFNNRVEALAA